VVGGRFALALAVTIPFVVTGIVGVNVFIDQKIAAIPRVKVKTAENTDPGAPANFLLIGSDTRAFVQTPEERQAYGDQSGNQGQRSDTLIVLHVDPGRKSGFLVSIPRDLEVEVPGMGKQKINAAYNAGPQRVVDTINQDFNIPIHHYLEVDFDSFKGIVDAMGGIPIYFAAPAKDDVSGLDMVPFGFKPGCWTLDGSNALGYVRSRDYQEYVDGKWQLVGQDAPYLSRIQRQQTFMRRLAVEAYRRSVDDPLAANRIADSILPKLKADNSLGRSDINKLISSFRKVDPNDPSSLEMLTLPTVAGPTTKALGSVLELKQPEADLVLARLRDLSSGPPRQQGPKPSQIRVRVFNGSAQSGAATKVGSELHNQGFVTVGVGNHQRVATTEVHYRRGSRDKATVVASYLGGVGKLVADNSIVEADVLVVLGKDFKSVTPPPNAAAPTPSAPSAAPAPGSPSTGTTPTTSASKGGNQAPPPTADQTQC
jgi:LCP family protein required for cell wall assembly